MIAVVFTDIALRDCVYKNTLAIARVNWNGKIKMYVSLFQVNIVTIVCPAISTFGDRSKSPPANNSNLAEKF
ncbi:MAG: hypothetical protein WCD53_08355 [Microcoleus sp.]